MQTYKKERKLKNVSHFFSRIMKKEEKDFLWNFAKKMLLLSVTHKKSKCLNVNLNWNKIKISTKIK